MRALVVLLVAIVVAAVHTQDTRRPAWSFVPSGTPNVWFATWPGIAGVMRVTACNSSLLRNELTITSQLTGHDRMTSVAVFVDAQLSPDTLMYVTSYDTSRVYRYQLSSTTGGVRGGLSFAAPLFPRGLVVSDDGERACVTGAVDVSTRTVRCYRITRALADDGVTLDEWWVMVSNFEWSVHTDTSLSATTDAVWFDSQARIEEAAASGSLWIDDTLEGGLIRFAVDSASGRNAAEATANVYTPGATHLTQTWRANADTHVIALVSGVFVRVQWTASGTPVIVGVPRAFEAVNAAEYATAVMWRQSALDDVQRLQLELVPGATVTVTFDRIAEALAIGEFVIPSPSATPTGTAAPTAQATPPPTPVPSSQGTPSPGALDANPTDAPAKSEDGQSQKPPQALWALTALLAVPCCLGLAFVGVVYLKRRRLLPARADAWLSWRSGGLQPINLASEHSADDQQAGTEMTTLSAANDWYEFNPHATMIGVPSRPDRNSPFALPSSR